MTKNLTESDLLDIIECADELITALNGTNEELHRDNSAKMCETWDHLNDHLAPPAIVKALAQEVIRLRKREVELENHAEKGWTWAGKLADDRTEQEARAEAAEAKLAELEKQQPYGYVHNLVNPPGSGVAASIFKEESRHYGRPVFTRPTPAISLAQLEKKDPITCDACIGVLSALGFHYKTAKLKDVLSEVKRLKYIEEAK